VYIAAVETTGLGRTLRLASDGFYGLDELLKSRWELYHKLKHDGKVVERVNRL
jgi:hypothetical protein